MSNMWIALLPFAAFFAWLFFFGMERRKACPNCNKPLPRFQSPFTKTGRQRVEGGYVCQNCGCEADIGGNKVSAGVEPKRRSIIIFIEFLAFVVVTAFILGTVILRR